jgi:hypothetical protein
VLRDGINKGIIFLCLPAAAKAGNGIADCLLCKKNVAETGIVLH